MYETPQNASTEATIDHAADERVRAGNSEPGDQLTPCGGARLPWQRGDVRDDREEHDDRRQVRDREKSEAHRRARKSDEQPGQRRADDPGRAHRSRAKRDRIDDQVTLDEVGDQRLTRREVGGVGGAEHDRDDEDGHKARVMGRDQDGRATRR